MDWGVMKAPIDCLRRRKVQDDAVRKAIGPDLTIALHRTDFKHLLIMKDQRGNPLFTMQYDKESGLIPEFMGKPIVWLRTNPPIAD